MQKEYKIKAYCAFVEPHYGHRDTGHNFQHILRIFSRLDELSTDVTPEPNEDTLFFLAAFHGLDAKLKDDQEFRQSVEIFLQQLGWQPHEIREGFVSLHRHLSAPKTSEEMIVHDANFFEVTGAFGIAKAFTVGGHYGQSYEQTLAIFENNLNNVKFMTPVGKSTYAARKQSCLSFIKELKEELELPKTL